MDSRPTEVVRQLLHTSDVMQQLQVTRMTALKIMHECAEHCGRKLGRIGVFSNITIREFCDYLKLDESRVRCTLPETPPKVPRRLRAKQARKEAQVSHA